MSNQQMGRGGSRSSGGRGGGSGGRGGGRSGRNDRSNNNNRGNRSGGNVRKVSVHEALYNQNRGAIDATGMSKREVISRMKKGNVGAGQMEQFVSDLFSVQPQEQKPKEESWSQVPKKVRQKSFRAAAAGILWTWWLRSAWTWCDAW